MVWMVAREGGEATSAGEPRARAAGGVNPCRRSRIAWGRLVGPIAAVLLWLQGAGRTPTEFYVANPPVGDDANSGCVETAPKATLTGPMGALAAVATRGPGPRVIHLRAGSTFLEGPIEPPSGIEFRYWDPARTGLPVTIAADEAMMAGWTPADGVFLTATSGGDGPGPEAELMRTRVGSMPRKWGGRVWPNNTHGIAETRGGGERSLVEGRR